MSPSRYAAGRRRAVRAIVALAAASACVGAVVAYAETQPQGVERGVGLQRAVPQPSEPTSAGPASPGAGSAPSGERLLRPRLIEAPPQTTAASEVQFRFHVQSRKPPAAVAPVPAPDAGQVPPPALASRHFQCRVDGAEWSDCQSPYRLSDLEPGAHRIAIRAFNREERAGETVAYEWEQTAPEALAPSEPAATPVGAPRERALEPLPFSIVALRDPADLYPGLAATPIPVRVDNPNDVAIEVTAITVAIEGPPASCGAENFELTAAGVSSRAPLVVPAGASVELPSDDLEAPTIRMLDLPVEQDGCRGAAIPLVFAGEAHG